MFVVQGYLDFLLRLELYIATRTELDIEDQFGTSMGASGETTVAIAELDAEHRVESTLLNRLRQRSI